MLFICIECFLLMRSLYIEGIPQLMYGLSAIFLIEHTEYVQMSDRAVPIYFLYEEDKGLRY